MTNEENKQALAIMTKYVGAIMTNHSGAECGNILVLMGNILTFVSSKQPDPETSIIAMEYALEFMKEVKETNP